MSEITITITADEDDLLKLVQWDVEGQHGMGARSERGRVSKAIAAALPRPRIVVRPGMVLRRNSDRTRWMAWGTDILMAGPPHPGLLYDQKSGLDPDEWTVVLEAEPS